MNPIGEFVRVTFRVRCETRLGQSVSVNGSTFSMGSMNLKNIIPLYTTPESYPIWYTLQPILIPREELLPPNYVTYRFCITEGQYK